MSVHPIKLETIFNRNVMKMNLLKQSNTINLTNEQKLDLYKYYKQGTHHHASNTPPPRYNIYDYAKWNAHNSVKFMSTDEAMKKYIELSTEIQMNISINADTSTSMRCKYP